MLNRTSMRFPDDPPMNRPEKQPAATAGHPTSDLRPFTAIDTQVVAPLIELIRSEADMAARLLAEHADDGSGRCRCCSSGAQAGRYQYPCAIARAATDAAMLDRVGDDTSIGGGQ